MASDSKGKGVDHSPLWPVEIGIGEGVTISIFGHEFSNCRFDTSDRPSRIPCWTYISSGLQALGQPELVVTLRRRPEEAVGAWSREPLEWFKIVASWGRDGRIIDAFHTHRLESAHWLGSKHLNTATYVIPRGLEGIPSSALPPVRLHGIVLTGEEVAIALVYGWTRVVVRHGMADRWFRHPPYIDRDRKACITTDMMSGSLRADPIVSPRRIRGVSVTRRGDTFTLEIPPGRELEIKALVEETSLRNITFALDCALHPEADFCATWEAGQTKALRGISLRTSPSVMGFAFLVVIPQQDNDYWLYLEDGCGLWLTTETWSQLMAELTSKRNMQLRFEDGVVFNVVFSRTQFWDYFTNLPENESTASVLEQSTDTRSHVVLQQASFANADAFTWFETRLFVNFTEQIVDMLRDVIPPNPGSRVQPKLCQLKLDQSSPDWPWELVMSPDAADLDLGAIGVGLKRVVQPEAWKDRPVELKLICGIWGGRIGADSGLAQ